jgi:hypothetical protein
MKNSPPFEPPAHTLEQLLKLHDEAFVRSAYKAILGRAPDQGGLENYLSQVRAGIHKAHILAELAQSPEGRLKAAPVPGLHLAIAQYAKHASSVWVRMFRRLGNASVESTDRQLRIMDNRLYLVEQAVAQQTSQFVELLTLANQGAQQSVDYDPSLLSPGVVRTFAELKAAIAEKQRQ